MKTKKQSVFSRILVNNNWLAKNISEKENISKPVITKIKKTGKWYTNTKHKVFCYLVENNYIRVWEYTLTELFQLPD